MVIRLQNRKTAMDKTKFGEEDYERSRKKPKFDRSKFEGFK